MRCRQRAALQQLEEWVLQRDAYAEEVGLMSLLSCPFTVEICTYFNDGILVKHVTLPNCKLADSTNSNAAYAGS